MIRIIRRNALRSLFVALVSASTWVWAQDRLPANTQHQPGMEHQARIKGGHHSHSILTTSFRGRRLSYVVIDGVAVHGGDIVLGRAEDLIAVPARADSKKGIYLRGLKPRELSARDSEYLWPNGVVPYVIDGNVAGEQRQNILAGIQQWNELTVISLVSRTSEPNYVRFANTAGGNCRSSVGMVGGEQVISLPPGGCSVTTIVHEIGHAVGLWHEHQREDRSDYVTVQFENLNKGMQHAYFAEHLGNGPYDYASAMHYSPRSSSSNGGKVFETIPPGMWIPSEGLSAGDIDGVARLYGKPPVETTIATNPPGLAVEVDGIRTTTPATFRWTAGTSHIVEAPVSQAVDGARYLFGRWNDGGQRLRNVAASPDATWLEANFIVQYSVGSSVEPSRAGAVRVSPPSEDGFYTLGTELRAKATPNRGSGYRFKSWGGTLWGQHGRASNPAKWRVDRAGKSFDSTFTDRPLYRVEANVEPFVLHLTGYYDGGGTKWTYAPVALFTDLRRTEIGFGLEEVQRAPRKGLERYRFEGWSDGGAISHSVRLPRRGGALTAQFASEFPLTTHVARTDSGSVSIDPASGNRYYRAGTSVAIRANPAPSWEFLRWIGDIQGRDATATVEMDRPIHVEAVFSQTPEIKLSVAETVELPATNYRFFVYDQASGFRVHPPDNAGELIIKFESTTSEVDVGVFVTADSDRLLWHYKEDGTAEFHADFQSRSPSSLESIKINAESSPPLDTASTYFVSLVVFTPFTEIRGTLEAQVSHNTSVRRAASPSPRALTFVSSGANDPAPQLLRLANDGIGFLRYEISSDQYWLATSIGNGFLAAGANAEIEVRVNGAGLWSDTHRGELKITSPVRNSEYPLVLATVPVTYVQAPPDIGDEPPPRPSAQQVLNRASRVSGAAPAANLIIIGNELAVSGGAASTAALEGSAELPTVLHGTSVKVTDSSGRSSLSGVLFASPTFVSFLVPEGVATGAATVSVRREQQTSEPFAIQIANVAPGLFSANQNGAGPAWAWAIRVKGNGDSSLEPLTDFEEPLGNRPHVPLDLGDGSDKVYLDLVGTGMRGWKRELLATLAGQSVDVERLEPSVHSPGLDRIVVGPLLGTLKGKGEVEVVLIADGVRSNTVTIRVQ